MRRISVGVVVMGLAYACGQPAHQSTQEGQGSPTGASASSAAPFPIGSAQTSIETSTASASTSAHAASIEVVSSDVSSAPSTTAPVTTSELETASSSSSSTAEQDSASNVASASDEPSSTTTAATSTSELGDAGSSEASEDPTLYAGELDGFYLHDACTATDPSSDVCTHVQLHEETFTFGGERGTTYEVRLRIRGLFEPTTITGGTTPDSAQPYFKVGGTVAKTDYSQWQIRVSEPEATYYLNHYPATGHTIYKEDFEASIQVRGGSGVTVRVEDSNDRQIDNGYVGLPDRQQTIEGVTDGVLDGQVLRLDVLAVTVLE